MKKGLLLVGILAVIAAVCTVGLTAGADILIGTNYEMSGAVATFGQACVNSAQLAVDEINAAGGLLGGRKVKLVVADNKSDAAEAGNMATKLIAQDKVIALLGPVTSTDALAAGAIAQDKGIPMISPTATNPKVTQVGNYIFRACFLDDFQGTVMATFAAKNLKAKTAALMIDNQSDYAKGLANFFKQNFIKQGGKIVAEEGFMPDDKDFRALLNKIRLTNPDVLYVPAYYQPDGLIAKQAREMKMMMPILGGDGWDSPDLVKIAGEAALNNIFFSNHFSPESDNPLAVKYVKSYKERFGMLPDALAALGYDAARVIMDAIARAKSDNPKLIRDALAITKGFKGVAGLITMDENRNPVKSAIIIELKNGVQTFKAEVEP